MKIAIIGSRDYDSLEFNLNEAFNTNHHQSEIFDIKDRAIFKTKTFHKYVNQFDILARRFFGRYDMKIFNQMAERVEAYNPDLIICVYRFIHPIFVARLKNKKRKIIHVNPDALTTFEYQQVFASNYDAWFTKDPYIVQFMKDKMNLNVFLYNEAFNKRIHKRPDVDKLELEKKINIDVAAYGGMYPYRCRMLSYLHQNGVELSLFGTQPPFFDKSLAPCFKDEYITGKRKAEILYGSKIVFNNLHYAEIESVNNKFWEINGSGAFQICDYKPIMKDLLPVDPELVTFRKIDEAVEKIKYYLNHDQERIQIADKIYNHFIQKYSYDDLILLLMDKTFN